MLSLGGNLSGGLSWRVPAVFEVGNTGDNRDMGSGQVSSARSGEKRGTGNSGSRGQGHAGGRRSRGDGLRPAVTAEAEPKAEQERAAPEAIMRELPPDRYLDREESWLRFNQRVLELAEDESLPLLERVRFVAIFASNLDEFFMVRVAGRIRRMATGLPVEQASGRAPEPDLLNTLETARELAARHARCFSEQLLPALAGEGIEILRWKELCRRGAGEPPEAVPGADLPGADPAGGRPGAPVPLSSPACPSTSRS